MKNSILPAVAFVVLLAWGCLPSHRVYQQNEKIIDTSDVAATVIANPQYDKPSAFTRILLGEHYRKEWATPVVVEVLDMDKEGGGLTPLREGGGRQTKSLRLRGADGKEYVLRSVNKDPTRAMPPEFVGTFAQTIVQDQISSSNPYAAVAIAELSRAAGIYHATPKIVFVPDTEKLGVFRAKFANTLCLFEERPSGSQTDNSDFDYAHDIVNSEKMLSKIFSDNDHLMDQRAFLKVRLFDTWLGDWDRHEDQYVWATFKINGKTIYKPIPRDRDQAFAKLDGIIPKSASRRWAIRKTKNFEEQIHDVVGLNMVGIYLDRNFTTLLTREDWKQVVEELQQRLTDDQIEAAFQKLPRNIYEISGAGIISKLKSRRNQLMEHALIYYKFLSKEVDVVGTSEGEMFHITRLGDSVKVEVYNIGKDNRQDHNMYKRTFYDGQTREVRLYGLDGKDQFHFAGEGSEIKIRAFGGGADDVYISEMNSPRRKNLIYDAGSSGFQLNGSVKKLTDSDTMLTTYDRKGFKYDHIAPKLAPGYNPDDGVYLGGGVIIIKQKFGKSPFGYMQSIWGNHSFTTKAYNFWYEGIFTKAVGNWDLHVNLDINAPNFVFNYFGQGNESQLPGKSRDFNRVRSDQIIFSPGLGRVINKSQWLAKARYQTVEVEKSAGRFVSDPSSKLDSSDFQRQHFGSLEINYLLDRSDDFLFPHKGIRISSAIGFTQNLNNSGRGFPHVSFDFAGFVPLRSFTLALRAGVASNLTDDFEFYQSNTLGGTTNLRGYRRNRFAGKTSLYENAELRFRAGTLNWYILRGQTGFLAFLDGGRVWVPNESSNKWHWGYGGGIWFLPFNKLALTLTYGLSDEDRVLNVRAGFLF